MRTTPLLAFTAAGLALAILSACSDDRDAIPYAAITDIRETSDGRLLVAGYSSPDISMRERGFIELLGRTSDLEDFTSRLKAAEIPEESGLPPIWGVTECAESEFVAVTGNWAPFTAVTGPEWEVQSLPASWALVGIEGSSCDDVLAVGRKEADDSGKLVGVVARYDGDEWTEMALPEGTPSLVKLWRGDIGTFAVGNEGTILTLTEAGWVAQDSQTDANLRAIWGGTERLFAAGGAVDGRYEVLEYDGAAWSVVAHGKGTLLAIHGRADDDVYAVGGATVGTSGAIACTVLHFDGTEWSPVECSHGDAFWDVWALGDGRVLAGGDNATLVDVAR